MTPFLQMQLRREKGDYIFLATYCDDHSRQLAINEAKAAIEKSGIAPEALAVKDNKAHQTIYVQVREYGEPGN